MKRRTRDYAGLPSRPDREGRRVRRRLEIHTGNSEVLKNVNYDVENKMPQRS